jgi:hypothetical protein
LKKTLLFLLIGTSLITACSKNVINQPEGCEFQTDNPSGRSYSSDSVIAINYTKKNCGIMPMSSKNYWIYEDSLFVDGNFMRVQIDTLRYDKTWQSLEDNLVWWESNITIGLPTKFYANDSAFFQMKDRMFTPDIIDTKKDFSLFAGDSIRYLTSFDDNAATGRSVKMNTTIVTPAGEFNNWILFEKNARFFRRDQVYFYPGLGVIRYTREEAPSGTREIKIQRIATLLAYHIE